MKDIENINKFKKELENSSIPFHATLFNLRNKNASTKEDLLCILSMLPFKHCQSIFKQVEDWIQQKKE